MGAAVLMIRSLRAVAVEVPMRFALGTSAATPTAHWLEYVDWANAILAEPLRVTGGAVVVPERPGNGLIWNEDAVRKYRMA